MAFSKSKIRFRLSGRVCHVSALLIVLSLAGQPQSLCGQDVPPDSTVAEADSLEAALPLLDAAVLMEPASGGLPLFLTVGAGYGQRSDPCLQCTAPENTDSFTGHLSIGKYLGHGLGIGVDANVWERGHPGPQVADSAGTMAPTSLRNRLGNASLSVSWQVWRVWLRGGGGLAWAAQDFESTDGSGAASVVQASGKGIGYSFGGGVSLPLASMVSLAVFANWNAGSYDLASPEGILQRDSEHEYLEFGFGLTIR